MILQNLDSRERAVVLASIGLVVLVFSIGVYSHFNPARRVWEGKVWNVNYTEDSTVISSYGNGKITIKGIWDIEEESTYRITYRSRSKYFAQFDIEIEKIS